MTTKNDDTVSLKEYFEVLIAANDQRYTEVNIEKEKALKIKEEADKIALSLAREIQTYKDEAHNGLLKQWQSERGTYVTADKFEGAIKPLVDFMNSQQGHSKGGKDIIDLIKLLIVVAGFILGYFVLK